MILKPIDHWLISVIMESMCKGLLKASGLSPVLHSKRVKLAEISWGVHPALAELAALLSNKLLPAQHLANVISNILRAGACTRLGITKRHGVFDGFGHFGKA